MTPKLTCSCGNTWFVRIDQYTVDGYKCFKPDYLWCPVCKKQWNYTPDTKWKEVRVIKLEDIHELDWILGPPVWETHSPTERTIKFK